VKRASLASQPPCRAPVVNGVSGSRWCRWAQEIALLPACFLLSQQTSRIASVYARIGTANLFTESSLYMNLGFWRDQPLSLDDASDAMARLVASEADLRRGDRILDVGNGYGDQDRLWIREFEPGQIIGVNVAPEQVVTALARVPAPFDAVVGSATDLPCRAGFFAKVLALESGFHFSSRHAFLREAHRVLLPRGRLVMADVVLLPSGRGRAVLSRVAKTKVVDRLSPLFPPVNWEDRSSFEGSIRQAGFSSVRVTSIREHVFAPLIQFLAERLNDPEVRSRVHPVMRAVASGPVARQIAARLDYVIAVAEKAPA
jgi:ubiquinone/menaquinone biosynthesis C-methylase UbiE